MTTAPGQQHDDVIDLLVADHRAVEDLLVELESGTDDPQRREQVVEVVVAALVRHSVAEEEYLYPVVREELPDGGGLADRGLAAHLTAEKVMKRLAKAEPDGPAVGALATELVAHARAHIRVEEEQVFPRLREELAPQERRRLAVLVGMAKEAAPTRPHPAAPHRPPWNLLLAPGAGIVDQVRDSVSGRPTSGSDLEEDADR